jgi:integrase
LRVGAERLAWGCIFDQSTVARPGDPKGHNTSGCGTPFACRIVVVHQDGDRRLPTSTNLRTTRKVVRLLAGCGPQNGATKCRKRVAFPDARERGFLFLPFAIDSVSSPTAGDSMGRKRKDENIYKRGKVWYIRFWFRDKEYRESSKSEERKVAKVLLDQRRKEIEEGRFGGPKVERTRFEDLEKLILRDYEVNERRSLGSLHDRIASLRKRFGSVRPIDVTFAMLDEYVDKRRLEGAKNATIRYELVVFGRMFSLGIKAKMLVTKPPLPTIKVENARQGFFEADEIVRVLKHLPEYLRPPIEFAYLTGWRIGEVRKLTWVKHLDADGLAIRLEATEVKNQRGKVFPFHAHPDLARLISLQIDRVHALQARLGRVVPWLFPRDDGRQLGQFHRQWAKACREARVPGRVPHDLRRTAVRNLMRAGVQEKVAMALAGFKTRNVFDRYNIVSEADLADGVRRLAERSSGA